MEREKKFGVLLGTVSLCLGTVLIALILVIQGWGNMKSQLSDIEGTLQNIKNDISQMGNNLQQEVKESLRASEDRIEDFNVTYKNISQENETIQVHITFVVKESSLDHIIRVRAKGIQEELTSVEEIAQSDNGLDYECTMMLSYASDYEFDIYQTTSEGVVKKMNSDDNNGYFQTDIMNRTYLENINYEQTSNGIVLNMHVYNNTYGLELLELKKVELVLYGEAGQDLGKELYREDITNKQSESVNNSNESIALQENSFTEEFYYETNIPSSKFKDSGVMENAQWYLDVTYKNDVKNRIY